MTLNLEKTVDDCPVTLSELRAAMAPHSDYSGRAALMRKLVLWFLEAADVRRPLSTTLLGQAILSQVWGVTREAETNLYRMVLSFLGSDTARRSMPGAVGYGPESRRYGKTYRTYVWRRPELGWAPEEQIVPLTPVDKEPASAHNTRVCPHCRGAGKV